MYSASPPSSAWSLLGNDLIDESPDVAPPSGNQGEPCGAKVCCRLLSSDMKSHTGYT